MDEALFRQVNDLLAEIRPMVVADGGDIDLVRVEEGIVYIKLRGACVGCPLSIFTVKFGIEHHLKECLDTVKEVVLLD